MVASTVNFDLHLKEACWVPKAVENFEVVGVVAGRVIVAMAPN